MYCYGDCFLGLYYTCSIIVEKKIIAAFDFDGTITSKDTLIEFIKYATGKFCFYKGIILYSHLLLVYKLKLFPNWKMKQLLFSHFFRRISLVQFDAICRAFYREKGQGLFRKDACEAVQRHIAHGDTVIIVSASIENWVLPFGESLGVDVVVGTKVDINELGNLTGRFLTTNCYGMEKVKRINQLYPHRNTYYLIAYGDSRGDKELLSFADEAYYQSFE